MNSYLRFVGESVLSGNLRSTRVLDVVPRQFVIAGWTGRDAKAIQHHIHELAQLGVPPPSAVPLYYRASASLLTQSNTIETLGAESSGEAEPILFFADGEWWLTVGSDHTDRKVETYSVAVSKQMCPKPIASMAWRWSDVVQYQDDLQLRSRILEEGQWVDYQKGSLASIRPLESLRDDCVRAQITDAKREGFFVSCGTLGALTNPQGVGIRPASQMELEIFDPHWDRSIVYRYSVRPLPVVA